ncbi:MAG TPA: antibiotic biosynthesis monooxygenase [Terriglobales bacterium]
MTDTSIEVIVRFRVKPGNLELYKQAMDFILSTAEAKEPYVLEYNVYKNAESAYTQYERYADEAALHRHLEGTMESQIKWAKAIEIEQVIVLGDMSEHFWNLYGSENTHGYSLFRKIKR